MKARQIFRRVTLCVIAFAVGLSLANGTASAQDNRPHWYITGLRDGGGENAQSSYEGAIGSLRAAVSIGFVNNVRELRAQRSLVSMPVMSGQYERATTLYFWSDNLYLVGFRDSGNNVYHFSNVDGVDLEQRLDNPDLQFTTLSYTGDYTSIPGGSARYLLRYNARGMYQDFMNLGSFRPNSTSSTYTNSLLRVIRATAEAARNGLIRHQVSHSFRDDLSPRLIPGADEIENNWRRISNWVRNEVEDPAYNGTLTVGNRDFDTLGQITRSYGYLTLSRPR